VVSWEDLERARAERAAKDAVKEATSEAKRVKKANKVLGATPTARKLLLAK
jgi:hypothetical protein